MLTDLEIKKARPQNTPYKLTDERGLYLIVRPNGAKWWRQNFTIPGEPRRTMSLGVYPDVDLASAREERERVRKLVVAGVNPVAERQQRARDDSMKFASVAARWLESNAHWTKRNHDVLKRRLELLIYPDLGSRDIRRIEPPDLLRVIRQIEDKGRTELPKRMNAACGSIFRFAIAEGIKTRDPSHDIKDALKKQPAAKHHAFIRPEKMGEFLVKLRSDQDEELDTLDALMLTILCAARTAETRFASVGEFERLGTPDSLWRIPAHRMKKPREHLVPLSRQADEIVRRRIEALPLGQTMVFGRRTRSGVISENTMIFAMYRLGFRGRATVHGFRSTFSTHANAAVMPDGRRMWEADWTERAIAHVPDDVRHAYNAAEYLPQRRRLLQWWADWLDGEYATALLIG